MSDGTHSPLSSSNAGRTGIWRGLILRLDMGKHSQHPLQIFVWCFVVIDIFIYKDSNNARLSPCGMKYLSTIPATVILIAVLSYVSHRIFRAEYPQWTKPFIPEQPMIADLPTDCAKQRMGWVVTLLTISLAGFSTELIRVVLDGWPSDLSLLIAWVRWDHPCGEMIC